MTVRNLTAATALVVTLAAGLSVSAVTASSDAAPAGSSYLLVGGTGSSNIGVLREAAGRLSDTRPTVPTGTGTLSIAAAPNGRYVYVAHTVSGSVQGFRVNGDGSLDKLEGAYLTPGGPVTGTLVSPDGKWLFATVGTLSSSVETYAIAPSGALSRVDSVPVPGATSGLSIPVASPDGRFLFVPSFIGATIDSFAIGSDGRLSPVGAQMHTGDRPALPSVTPNGKFLYITNEGSNDVSGFRIEPNGALTDIGRFPTKTLPHGMAITPDGRYLYLPQTGAPGVNGFSIGADGALTPLPGADITSDLGHFPGRVVLSPDAQRLYIIDTLTLTGTEKVFTYRVLANGALEPTGRPAVDTGVTFSDGATGVFVTPDA